MLKNTYINNMTIIYNNNNYYPYSSSEYFFKDQFSAISIITDLEKQYSIQPTYQKLHLQYRTVCRRMMLWIQHLVA